MMHFFISSLMHILICFSCFAFVFHHNCFDLWMPYIHSIYSMSIWKVGSGINVIMSEMASNFFGIVAQSIQRKTFLREFSTNGKSLSHFHCDCRNCQMLLKFFVLYLLFVDEFYKGYFLLYSYMSIHELRHIFDAFCYIAALLNKF